MSRYGDGKRVLAFVVGDDDLESRSCSASVLVGDLGSCVGLVRISDQLWLGDNYSVGAGDGSVVLLECGEPGGAVATGEPACGSLMLVGVQCDLCANDGLLIRVGNGESYWVHFWLAFAAANEAQSRGEGAKPKYAQHLVDDLPQCWILT